MKKSDVKIGCTYLLKDGKTLKIIKAKGAGWVGHYPDDTGMEVAIKSARALQKEVVPPSVQSFELSAEEILLHAYPNIGPRRNCLVKNEEGKTVLYLLDVCINTKESVAALRTILDDALGRWK